MQFLLLPLLVLSATSCYLSGIGLNEFWLSHTARQAIWPAPYVISAALHAAWIWCAAHPRAGGAMLTTWVFAFLSCRAGLLAAGFATHAFMYAFLAEGAPLALALALTNMSWSERLASWRRARADIATQLRMGQGIIPWMSSCVRQLLTGSAERPAGIDSHRLIADLTDAECRLRVRLSRMAIPEQVRQSILTQSATVMAEAELAAARFGLDLEQKVLTATAVCRDLCAHVEDTQPDQQQALAAECESHFLNLIRKGATP